MIQVHEYLVPVRKDGIWAGRLCDAIAELFDRDCDPVEWLVKAAEQDAILPADIVNLLAYAQGNCFIEEDELRRIMDGIEEVLLEAEQENHFQRLRWLPSRHGIRFGTLIKETVRQIVSVRC